MFGNSATLIFVTAVLFAAGCAMAVAVGEFLELRRHSLVGLALAGLFGLLLGFVFSVLSLGRPQLLFGLIGNPASRAFWLYLSAGLTLICLLSFSGAQIKGAEATGTRFWAVAVGFCGAAAAVASGNTLVMPWRPVWNTHLITASVAAFGLVSAVSSFQIVAARSGRAIGPRPLLCALLAAALLVAAYIVFLLSNPALRADGTAWRPLTGDMAIFFWAGTVVLGLLLPLALAAWRGGGICKLLVQLLLPLVGAAAFVQVIMRLGQSVWHFFRIGG